MSILSQPARSAFGIYLVGLLVTTVIAMVMFETFRDIYVVPLEYLIPLGPAIVAYRKAREKIKIR